MKFNLTDLANYFNDSAKNSKDVMANRYGALGVDDTLVLYDQVVEEIEEILDQPTNKSILDVGCGTGEILSRVTRTCPESIGLEISIEMVRIVEGRGFAALAYEGGTFPFKDNSFDIVLIYQVLINLPDAYSARNLLQEASRVVRNGGRILVGAVPHPTRSALPTHAMALWKELRMQSRRIIFGAKSIPYYSYKYEFFGSLFDDFEFQSIEFLPCHIQVPAWQTKYHVLLVK
jgi:ubiquinone/menaquinone biosynthesis C-methylase UbiE